MLDFNEIFRSKVKLSFYLKASNPPDKTFHRKNCSATAKKQLIAKAVFIK